MSQPVQVKICGLRDVAMARVAAEAGADFIGLVFVPNTPRRVTVTQAAQIVSELASKRPNTVGLFVDASVAEMNDVADKVGLDYLQLAGNEALTIVSELNRPVIKTLRCGGQQYVDELLSEVESWHKTGATVLLDAPGINGGHGKLADWDFATAVTRRYDVLLAGGLTADNVSEAIKFVQPWAVDVSSGVERERGVKDATLISEFIKRAKGGWRIREGE
jgi:phosphoribosylanthranilate isomerase